MLDLLLVNTPIHDYGSYPKSSTSYSTPLGLFYIHSYVTKAGFSCEIIDAEAAKLSVKDVVEVVQQKRPRFIGLNAFSVNFGYLWEISRSIPAETKMIVGGPHITLSSLDHLAQHFSFVHYIVRGAGEVPVARILEGVSNYQLPESVFFHTAEGVLHRGLVTQLVQYPSLEDLPFPSRGVTPYEPYIQDRVHWADIAISRGCEYRCAFCSGSSYSSGLPYKQRAIESSLLELEELSRSYAVQGVEIVDDLPFRNRVELSEFLEAAEHRGFRFQWEINLPITVALTLSFDELSRLRKLGLSRIAFGIESGDERVRKSLGKNASDFEIIDLCRRLCRVDILHKVYLIIGFPGETEAETKSTLDLAKRIRSEAGGSCLSQPRLFIFKPFPGSFLWQELSSEYSEEALLEFLDYSLGNSYFNKHAWLPKIQFSDTPTARLVEYIDDYYGDE